MDGLRFASCALCAALTVSCAPIPKDVKTDPAVEAEKTRSDFDNRVQDYSQKMIDEGRETFRYDSFGSEEFWGGALKLHQAILGEKQGGVGAGLSPRQALQAGLKVDAGKLPKILAEAIKGGAVSLDNPETTLELLRASAVVGVKGVFDDQKRMTSIGITCALCHSTVDNSLTRGIGSRLDGWPNRDLNVGAVVAMAPTLKPFVDLLGVFEVTQSMSRAADVYDNAVMESFFASYKLECVPAGGFGTRQQARSETFEYIEVFYNRQRLHSTLGYLTPAEAEQAVGVS